jgi:hypothetical protein
MAHTGFGVLPVLLLDPLIVGAEVEAGQQDDLEHEVGTRFKTSVGGMVEQSAREKPILALRYRPAGRNDPAGKTLSVHTGKPVMSEKSAISKT